MDRDVSWLESRIRDVPDFPQPGIVFKDLTPLMDDAEALRMTVDALADFVANLTPSSSVDKVVGVEARGFSYAAAIAYRLGAGFIPVRKSGKLPWDTLTETYELEYGTDSLQIHRDAISPGETVYVVDDVLATGGTASATCRLVEGLGGEVAAFGFVVELGFLKGRAKLTDHEVYSLMTL
jgi:adenine phosphoribosyltransferase